MKMFTKMHKVITYIDQEDQETEKIEFTDQVLSAAQKTTDSGWRLSKGRSKRKIDSAIAMVLMIDRITAPTPKDENPEVAIINL